MPTTTRAVLRQRLSEAIGDYWTGTIDSGDADSIVDTELADLTSDDDGIQGWVFIDETTDDGAPVGEFRRILTSGGYTASSTTIELSRAFSDTVAEGDTYELHRYDPDDIHNAINRAIELLYPTLYLPIRDETLVVDNQLLNWDFETDTAGNFNNWTAYGSPTPSTNTTFVMHGVQSASIAAAGSVGHLWQDITVNLKEVTNRPLVFKCWVYATAASAGRIRIDWDGGTTFSNSEYHSGDDQWELLDVQVAVPDGATQIRFMLEVAASQTCYFDAAYATLGPIYRYAIPTSIVLGPHHVYQQSHEDHPGGNYFPLGKGATPGRILRLEGQNILTRPAAGSGADLDTNTTEVDGARVALIVARAAQFLYEVAFNPSSSAEAETYKDRATYWRGETQYLSRQPGVRMVPMSASLRDGWHVEEDATARYLVLDGYRGD